jgi:hypothetical protein
VKRHQGHCRTLRSSKPDKQRELDLAHPWLPAASQGSVVGNLAPPEHADRGVDDVLDGVGVTQDLHGEAGGVWRQRRRRCPRVVRRPALQPRLMQGQCADAAAGSRQDGRMVDALSNSSALPPDDRAALLTATGRRELIDALHWIAEGRTWLAAPTYRECSRPWWPQSMPGYVDRSRPCALRSERRFAARWIQVPTSGLVVMDGCPSRKGAGRRPCCEPKPKGTCVR